MTRPELTFRQRQVLDFVASFESDEGYLPTMREIAVGCGLRSPTSARRALQALEDAGWIVRDPKRPRLGVVSPARLDRGGQNRNVELLVCDSILVEMEAAVERVRRGLAFAPDFAAAELLHQEALARIRLSRVYRAARDRLVRAGARLPSGADAALDQLRVAVSDRTQGIASWDAYCLGTLIERVAIGDWLEGPLSGEQAYLRPAYAAERTLLRLDERPDLRSVRDRVRRGDLALNQLATEYVVALRGTFDGLAAAMPEPSSANLQTAAGQALDNALVRLPSS